jgi:AcrR family transcriptional regulator
MSGRSARPVPPGAVGPPRLPARDASPTSPTSTSSSPPSSTSYASPRLPPPIVGSQRARILQAIVQIVAERGCGGATIALVSARAKVSRRTFYQQFKSVDDGLLAVMDTTLEHVAALAFEASEGQAYWPDRMRAALGAVLAFFDSEPQLARVCLVETLGGGPMVLEHRGQVVSAFRELVAARLQIEVSDLSPMVAEGMLASVMGIVHARMTAREPQALVTLLGPLMGTIVAPFADQQTVVVQTRRAEELAQAIQRGETRWAVSAFSGDGDPPSAEAATAASLALAGGPLTRRACECLSFLAEQGGRGLSPSNRQVAEGIGIAHQSQISRLLAELLARGLVVKSSEGAGKRNAWKLTPDGEALVHQIVPHTEN